MSTVGEGYVAGVLEVADRMGLEREVLLRHAGVDGLSGGLLQSRLPMAEVIALFESVQSLSGREDVGLEFARRVRPGTFHVLGYALMTCKTLGDAIALVPHYRRLVFDIGYSEMRLTTSTAEARLAWHVVSHDLPYSRPMAESLIAAWYMFGRWIAGVDLPLQAVNFMHAAPQDDAPYADFFSCPVRFGALENALIFDRSLLTMPLVQADETLHLAMREQARAALEKAFPAHDITQRLRQALLPLMPKCEATLDKAALALGRSPRSLQRSLAAQGQKFQEILDTTRKDLARIYLRDPGLSALYVALLLGYAEQSSFTRAFRGWMGTSPSVWRQANR